MSHDLPVPPPITVYVVEDDGALRDDFARAVSGSTHLQLLGATGSAQQALRALEEEALSPDVMLVDLGLPDGDGTSVIRALRRHHPMSRALVISVFDDDRRVLDALSAGAQGYLLKDTDDEALVRAIREVARGDAPLSPQVARFVLRLFESPRVQPGEPAGRPAPAPAGDQKLTVREAEILTLVSRGLSAREVAERIGLSVHTVNTHLRSCHAKLDAKNRQQAVNRARGFGQID